MAKDTRNTPGVDAHPDASTSSADTSAAAPLPSMRTWCQIDLVGHLRAPDLERVLAEAEQRLEGSSALVLVDALNMTDYDAAARELFIGWNRKHKARIRAVAIVTDKTLWHMVIRAMSLASGQHLHPFRRLDDAQAWLRGLVSTAVTR